MKTILSIFHNDIKSIIRSIFVLLIVAALAVMPSLYAWINIFAAWDPYVNTGDLPVALASRDSGIDKNGVHINRAEEMISEIRNDTNIKYCPLEDPEEAVEGVKSGEYYAAFIFEDGYTYDIENLEAAVNDEDAKITNYSNIKKNAPAVKITDGVAEDLLKKINKQYVRTMLEKFFGDTDELVSSLDSDEAVEDALAQLTEARDALHAYNQSIEIFLGSSGNITGALDSLERHLDADRSQGRSEIADAKKVYKQAKKDLKTVSHGIEQRKAKLDKSLAALEEIVDALKQPIDAKERQRLVQKAEEILDNTLVILQDLRAMIPEDGKTPASRIAAATLDLMIDMVKDIQKGIGEPSRIDEIAASLEALKKINDEELLPALKLMVSDLKSAMKLVRPLLSSTASVLDDLDPVLDSAGRTVSNLDKALVRLQATLVPLEDKLDEIIDKVRSADAEDRLDALAEALDIDPDRYSSFFTTPVEISVEKFYPADTYGEAMTPFYTIIALWVGGVMLVTILKSNINRRKFPQATETQGFFGRYAILFLLGQIQAAVTVAGDIFLLHCTPVHPWLMWFTASVASAVFILLIYALVRSFGNIGRAAVIVLMVLQIAGSSGSYPIEILPVIFAKLYKFYPYPYAIDAMREAMFGLYRFDYLIFLGQLAIFGVIAIVIGIFIRKPFIGVDRFVSEKLEETEVL